MIERRILVGWALAAATLAAAQNGPAPAPAAARPVASAAVAASAPVMVKLQTTMGELLLQVETGRAPVTAANFLRYVNQKRFDGSEFYRAMKIGDTGEYGLIQGGLRGNPKKVFKPIAHEPTNVTGLSHVNGALSMARAAPGSATADFFVVLGDLVTLDAIPGSQAADPATDAGYAVFGKVVEGMDLIKAVLELPRATTPAATAAMQGQMLAKPVKILTARVVEAPPETQSRTSATP